MAAPPHAIQAPRRELVACWAMALSPRNRQVFRSAGIPDFDTPEEAVRAFSFPRTYRLHQEGTRRHRPRAVRHARSTLSFSARSSTMCCPAVASCSPNRKPKRCSTPPACRWWHRVVGPAMKTLARPPTLGHPVALRSCRTPSATSPMWAACGSTSAAQAELREVSIAMLARGAANCARCRCARLHRAAHDQAQACP